MERAIGAECGKASAWEVSCAVRATYSRATPPEPLRLWGVDEIWRMDLKLFVCVVDDDRLLPHFLRHYVRSGVTEFHVAAPQHLANSIDSASRKL